MENFGARRALAGGWEGMSHPSPKSFRLGEKVHGEQSNTMLSINLLTFVMLRDARPGDTEPVIVILHECHVLQQSAIEALLNRTFGCTAMCMLIHFRPGTNYAALTLHPFFSAFLRMSLKFMVPDVDRN